MSMLVYMYVFLCTRRIIGVHVDQKRILESMELELHTIVSHHAVLGIGPLVFYKSQLPSHLPNLTALLQKSRFETVNKGDHGNEG